MGREPNSLTAFSMVLLRCEDRYLLLKRSPMKRFAPNRWTGVGGRVEPDEFNDLRSAALREIHEETGIQAAAVRRLVLRRSLLQARPGHPLTVLLYFTGEVDERSATESDEGELHWLRPDTFAQLDVIENTALVLPLLVEDTHRDPDGTDPLITGTATFNRDGSMDRIDWSQ